MLIVIADPMQFVEKPFRKKTKKMKKQNLEGKHENSEYDGHPVAKTEKCTTKQMENSNNTSESYSGISAFFTKPLKTHRNVEFLKMYCFLMVILRFAVS